MGSDSDGDPDAAGVVSTPLLPPCPDCTFRGKTIVYVFYEVHVSGLGNYQIAFKKCRGCGAEVG